MIRFVKKCVKKNRFENIISPALDALAKIVHLIPNKKHRKLIYEGRLFYANKNKNLEKIENIFVDYCQYFTPSMRLLNFYNIHIVASGISKKNQKLIETQHFPKEAIPLLKAAINLSKDNKAAALEELNKEDASFEFRRQYAFLSRKILHQAQDQAGVAQAGISFLEKNPSAIEIPFAISVAAAAEASNNEDIFCRAIKRIVQDTDRIIQDADLFDKLWRDAATASVTVFNIDQAVFIAKKQTT